MEERKKKYTLSYITIVVTIIVILIILASLFFELMGSNDIANNYIH